MNFVNNWSRPITLAAGALACPLDLPDGTYRLCISNTDRSLFEVVDAAVVSGTAALTRGREGTAAQSWLSGSTITASVTAEMLESFAAAGATWGGITGSLADQADLQAALSSKATSEQGFKADTAVQPASLTAGLALKVDKVDGYSLSQENFTPAEKAKLAALDGSLWKGEYPTLVALQAAHPTAAPGSSANVDAGAGDPVLRYIWDDNDSEWIAQAGSADPITAAQVKTLYESNPDTNAYTDAEKSKLGGIAAGATANANTDSMAEGSTNKYFTELRVLATLMAGFTLIAGGAVSAADSLLVAVGKLQKQINDLFSGKQDTLVSGTNIKTVNGSTLLGAGDLVVTGGASLPVIRAITGNETIGLANINTFGVNSTVSNYTSTIPAQATVAWSADAELHFLPSNTGDITITAAAGVSLNGVVAGSLTLSTQNGAASLKRTGADAWWLGGVIGTTAEQRAALGLGTASTANVTTSAIDTTAGALMAVGDFGVGAVLAPNITSDLDVVQVGGLYRYTIATLNLPFAGSPGTMQVIGRAADGSAWSQLATASGAGANRLALRSKAAGAITPWGEAWLSTNTNAITSENGSFGYGTGSGGTVTQATSKATGVTLNKPSGQVTTAGDALAANSAVSFTLTNNKIAANDIPKIVIKSGATAGAYVVQVDAVAAGSCRISIRNMTAGSLSETLGLQFNIEKGATA